MLVIQNVEYSKNPVSVGEAYLMSIAIIEVLALWNDIVTTTWGTLTTGTWDDVKRKIF